MTAPLYNPQHYVLEIHFDKDVFHYDYGPDQGCAMRAVARMIDHLAYDTVKELRVWYHGQIAQQFIASKSFKTNPQLGPEKTT